MKIVFVSTLVAAGFSTTVNLGAILVGALVLIVGGFFTLRTNVARTWHEAYEGEKLKREIAEAEAREQRELKHDLKAKLAAAEMRTDQTEVFKGIAQILDRLTSSEQNSLQAVGGLMEAIDARVASRDEKLLQTQAQIVQTQERTNKLLEVLTDRIIGKVDQVMGALQDNDVAKE